MSPLALSLRFLQAQPDSRLVALARDGHDPAFEALVRRYGKELLAYCRRLQPGSGHAEDTLQQALLQAWSALSRGAEVRDVRPWLYRIAHNVAMSNLRVATAVPREVSDASVGPDVGHVVEQRLQARAALAGLASLPPLQREVMLSAALDGSSHDEIANALGLSSHSVRGLIYRARANLRSAAAAITPSPVVHWALRRAEARPGGASAAAEALAGGGGAGVAGLIAKGGAVVALTGAVAGAGGVVLGPVSAPHHRQAPRHVVVAGGPRPAAADEHARRLLSFAARPTSRGARHADFVGRDGSGDSTRRSQGGSRGGSERGEAQGSGRGTSGSDGGSASGGSDRGSTSGSDGGSTSGSDGGATTATTTSSDGTGGSGSHDGGVSTTTTSSSDGGSGTSGSGTSGETLSSTPTDGGTSSGGGSGSGETSTTSGSH
jgi:RNA polymerase sigma factor (sigma-70 family)